MQLSKTISSLVWQFMSGNFLSKVSGLMRDVTMAYFFGADALLAAFIVSYRMANLLRRLFGEGALVAGFIPHFESLKVESEKKAFDFFKTVSLSMTLVLVAIITAFEFGAFFAIKYFNLSHDVIFITKMTAIMFPSLIFICLYGIYSGVLQSYKKFFETSIAPVVFNLIWVVVMVLSKNLDKELSMIILSWGVLLGFLFQFLFTAWQVRKISVCDLNLSFKLSYKENLKPLFASLVAGVIGVGATQINNACDVIFARMASLEAPAYLTYGVRIQQLPLSVFIIALSSVILPQLSRLVKLGEFEEFKSTLQTALHRAFFILLPITFMCLILGGAFVNVIYGRGGFDQLATIETTKCLYAYALGMIPMGFVILLAPAFYAQKDYKVTTIASCVSVSVNLVLNWVFITYLDMKGVSVAYATSIASFVNMTILIGVMKKRFGLVVSKKTQLEFLKISFAAVMTFVLVSAFDLFVMKTPSAKLLFQQEVVFPRMLFAQLGEFIKGCVLFVSTYLVISKVMKVDGVSLNYVRKLKKTES